MKKKIACLLALFCFVFGMGISAQSALQKAYARAKTKVDGTTGATVTKKNKSKEQLRKAAYKYRDDIPKEVLKMAKKDNAILHGTWIQGQTKAWDLNGKPLNIPDAYKPLRRYNDTLFAICNTMKAPDQPYRIEMYVLGKGGIGCVAKSLDDYLYQPFLNSVLVNDKTEYGYYWNSLYSLDGTYSFVVQKNEAMSLAEITDSCRKDTADARSVGYTKMMEAWKPHYFNSKVSDDQELYKNNVWVQKANQYYAMGEYRKALDCIEQFVTFDMYGINDKHGMFAHQLKFIKVSSLRNLNRYNAVLNTMDVIQGSGELAHDMYYSPLTNTITVDVGVSEDVKAAYKNKFLALCQECKKLQAEREQSNAVLAAAILGAVGGTVSNIVGGGNGNQTNAGYVGGAATSTNAGTTKSASTKTAPQCTACGGTGRCQACKNHPGRATANSKDKIKCANCKGHITCQYCGGSGYKKL